MSRPRPQNTLQQDLFLLAKNHYNCGMHRGLTKLEIAKKICAYHVFVVESSFRTQDVVFWLLKNFVETGIILTDRSKLIRFMLEHGKYQLNLDGTVRDALAGVAYLQQYHDILATDLLSEIRMLKVYDSESEKWLMPFEKPEVDPFLTQLFSETTDA